MRPVVFTSIAADDDYIAAAQQLAGAGNLVLNGVGVDKTVPAEWARVVIPAGSGEYVVNLTSAGNLSAVNFTIYGIDLKGTAIAEAIAGPNANTVTTTAYFSKVTRIAADAAVGTDVKAGIGIGRSNWIKGTSFMTPFNATIAVDVTGTINYTVQYTPDDLELVSSPSIFSHPDSAVVSATADAVANYAFPIGATRILVNSGSGSLRAVFTQAGL